MKKNNKKMTDKHRSGRPKTSKGNSKHFCFTWYYGDKSKDTCEKIFKTHFENENLVFILGGYEICPTTGRNHLQSYMQYKDKKSFNTALIALNKSFDNHPHMESCKGSDIDNDKYCSKDNNEIIKFGKAFAIDKQPGKRNDLLDIYEYINKNLSINDDIRQSHTYTRYQNSINNYLQKKINDDIHSNNLKQLDNVKLNKFQQFFLKELNDQNSREITWIYDSNGNIGKTFFAKYMNTKHDACIVLNGKSKDISEVYNNEDIVIMNFVRCEEDFINYSILENLKDGIIFKQKYFSRIINRSPVKLIVFSNFLPKVNALSADRWRLYDVNSKLYQVNKIHIEKNIINHDDERELVINY